MHSSFLFAVSPDGGLQRQAPSVREGEGAGRSVQGGISPGKAKKGTGASGFEADSCEGSFMRVTAGCHQSIGQKRAFRLTGK
ncbi:MAG: hypothetical protein CW342_13270 [Thermoactinomycetaceae bacterium]|nr:hypothetical protein [Thermoactinomycetaceae bacterium]